MSKVFSYHTISNGEDWFISQAYNDKQIEAITDPEGGKEIYLPTAIPTPFARIDLVKTAFMNISKTPDLKAYSIDGKVIASCQDEKLVSDTLDIAELMFNYDSIKNKLRIITWDKEKSIKSLKNGTEKQRRYGETLELYLKQDSKSYNFDLLGRIYLIEYDHHVVGGTSPATLYFTTGDDLSAVQFKLTTKDILFDENYCPLYMRECDFQKYLYSLFLSFPNLTANMVSFNDYLEKNLKFLKQYNNTVYNQIKGLKNDYYNTFSELNTGTEGDIIEIIGAALKKRGNNKPEKVSDFMINSSKSSISPKPLVLQNKFNKQYFYWNDYWTNDIVVPYSEATLMEKRILPGLKVQYPYLTVSDFLEPYIIRLVYPINNEKFFDGNLIDETGIANKGYILPLKKNFFDYFSPDDLLKTFPDGKKRIELIPGSSQSVKIILRIPINKEGEYISFERIYYPSSENELSRPDEERNKGIIVEHQFGLTIFPFIKTNKIEIEPYYRIQLIDRDVSGFHQDAKYNLEFYSNKLMKKNIPSIKKSRSLKKTNSLIPGSDVYILDKEFDLIQVNVKSASGFIIPKWLTYDGGNNIFTFSVDFGTTNTHIEYKIGEKGTPKPFEITQDDIQIATLFHPSKTTADFFGTGANAIRNLIEMEFVPFLIGKSGDYKFPHRTVIAESPFLNINTDTYTLADFNIPFIYERIPNPDTIKTNLKWAKKEPGNEIRVRRFFEELIMFMRNKVLLNKGDISKTKLNWFFPSSMKPGRISGLKEAWCDLFKKYFNSINEPTGITESLAPYFYYKGSGQLQGGTFKPVISIDIGGGTTDISIFNSKGAKLITSFRFAANTIFGDNFSEFGAAEKNGLINKYFPYFENLLGENKLYDLAKVLSTIKDNNNTEDINAFFFSIENSSKISDKKLLSYNSLLSQDEDLKIIFLYFFTAIFFHIAEIMKVHNFDLPKHIVFSGTGSKILNIITSDLTILTKFTKLIFEKVFKNVFDKDGLTLKIEKYTPKEVTAKGGLMVNPTELDQNIEELKYVLTCLEDNGVNKLYYDSLSDSYKTTIVNYVENFNYFFLELNKHFNFSDYFNSSSESIEIFKTEINKYLNDYLEGGLEYSRKLDDNTSSEKELEETLFFYPIIGSINNLIGILSSLSPVRK